MEDLAQLLVGGGLGSAAATAIVFQLRSLRRAVTRLCDDTEQNRAEITAMRETIARELHPNGGPPLAERVSRLETLVEVEQQKGKR